MLTREMSDELKSQVRAELAGGGSSSAATCGAEQ